MSTFSIRLVERAFADSIPVDPGVVEAYEHGFCDGDPEIGLWLRDYQGRLSAGEVDYTLVHFLLPGIFPRILGSALIAALMRLAHKADRWFFLEELWSVCSEPDLPNLPAYWAALNELTPTQCLVALMVVCRITKSEDFQEYGQDRLKEIIEFADRLASCALVGGPNCQPKVDRLATRTRQRINGLLAERGAR